MITKCVCVLQEGINAKQLSKINKKGKCSHDHVIWQHWQTGILQLGGSQKLLRRYTKMLETVINAKGGHTEYSCIIIIFIQHWGATIWTSMVLLFYLIFQHYFAINDDMIMKEHLWDLIQRWSGWYKFNFSVFFILSSTLAEVKITHESEWIIQGISIQLIFSKSNFMSNMLHIMCSWVLS